MKSIWAFPVPPAPAQEPHVSKNAGRKVETIGRNRATVIMRCVGTDR
jgi:hypothetical protein